MAPLMKWLILGWSLVVVLLWAFLAFRQRYSDQAIFYTYEDVWGFMGVVFLTWIIPLATFAFFVFLALLKNQEGRMKYPPLNGGQAGNSSPEYAGQE